MPDMCRQLGAGRTFPAHLSPQQQWQSAVVLPDERPGEYEKSCKNLKLNGAELSGEAQCQDGRYIAFVFNLDDFVVNDDGKLCVRGGFFSRTSNNITFGNDGILVQTEKQQQYFLVDTLTDCLFLWLQSEDRQAYTIDNMFETSNDVFFDAVIDRIAREHKREDEARWREANLQRQREADLKAERLENERLEREAEEREIQERLR
ncbi:hypothetical protein L7F22_034564 [Adiantum nelumboides]|nr:hypothetical protein [Adiantum nelumboides]